MFAAFGTSWMYNSAGFPMTMIYPDGEQVTYGYNSRMLLETLTGSANYVTGTEYDAARRVTSRGLGNGLSQGFEFYAWNEKATVDGNLTGQGGRLKLLSAGTLQSLSYLYDATGNVRKITDPLTSEEQAFGYDNLDRLSSATVTGGPAPYSESYIYNASSGNLQSKNGLTYTYSMTHPHAVSEFNGNTYGYDANGNMTQRVIGGQTYTLGYDAENRMVSVSRPAMSASFMYDGDGRRVKSTINGLTTSFVGNYYEVSGGVGTKYYYAGSAHIAMRSGTSLYYLLGDHLGSTSITTDESGFKRSELRYSAWGETRYASGATPTAYRYTGQREEASFGLYFYQARWYDPYLNHFTQPDTIVPDPYNPQSLNRYAYALNNPLRYTDPSGHWVDEGCGSHICNDTKTSGTQVISGTRVGNSIRNSDGGLVYSAPPLPYTNPNLDGSPPPVDGYYCQSSALTCWANFTQDMATTIDSLFAGVEVVFVIGGCAAGGPAGCGAGLLTSWEIFNTGPNQLESALSGLSLVLTTVEDYSVDKQLGESTGTSFTTFVVGGMSPDPIADVIIDGYASGYNHGFFNGIGTLMNGRPFLQNPAIYR